MAFDKNLKFVLGLSALSTISYLAIIEILNEYWIAFIVLAPLLLGAALGAIFAFLSGLYFAIKDYRFEHFGKALIVTLLPALPLYYGYIEKYKEQQFQKELVLISERERDFYENQAQRETQFASMAEKNIDQFKLIEIRYPYTLTLNHDALLLTYGLVHSPNFIATKKEEAFKTASLLKPIVKISSPVIKHCRPSGFKNVKCSLDYASEVTLDGLKPKDYFEQKLSIYIEQNPRQSNRFNDTRAIKH